MCLAGAHSMKAQEAPASTNQDKKPIPVVNLRLNASSRALKDVRVRSCATKSWWLKERQRAICEGCLGSLTPAESASRNRASGANDTNASNDEASKEKVDGISARSRCGLRRKGSFTCSTDLPAESSRKKKSGWTTGLKKWVNKESGIERGCGGCCGCVHERRQQERCSGRRGWWTGPGRLDALEHDDEFHDERQSECRSLDGDSVSAQQYRSQPITTWC